MNTNKITYSFLKIISTNEIHIFEGQFDLEKCQAKEFPICKNVSRIDNEVKVLENCINENGVRIKAALIGRTVCGICVSHLYQSY